MQTDTYVLKNIKTGLYYIGLIRGREVWEENKDLAEKYDEDLIHIFPLYEDWCFEVYKKSQTILKDDVYKRLDVILSQDKLRIEFYIMSSGLRGFIGEILVDDISEETKKELFQ